MADQKITQLVDGGAPQATDEFVVARAGDNFKIDYASLESETLNDAVILAPATDARNVIEPTLATVTPLTIRGAAGQSDTLFLVEANGGSDLFTIASDGSITVSDTPSTPSVASLSGAGLYIDDGATLSASFVANASSGTSALSLYGANAAGAAHIGVYDDYAGTIPLFVVDGDGGVTISPSSGSVIAAIVKAHAAQSVDLTQWQKSDATVIAKVGETGAWTLTPDLAYFVPALLIDSAMISGGGIFSAQAPVSSSSSDNFNDPVWGKHNYDFYTEQIDGIADKRSGVFSMYQRRTADMKIIGLGEYRPNQLYVSTQDPDAGDAVVSYAELKASDDDIDSGVMLWNSGGLWVTDDVDHLLPRFRFQRVASVWKFGIFGSAVVAQQAASTIPDLWTALKNYGWLTSGSTAPAVYAPGGTDVAVADGGTGASTAAAARTNLGLVIGTNVASQAAAREIAQRTGEGLLTENFSRQVGAGTLNAADGTVLYQAVGLLDIDTVTNLHIFVTSAGAGVTVAKMGLYAADGTLLAATADLGTAWHTAGTKTHALTAPFAMLADGLYYIAMVVKWSTTAPQFLRSANASAVTAIGAFALPYGRQTGQTDLPSPGTIAAGSGVSCIWVGAS